MNQTIIKKSYGKNQRGMAVHVADKGVDIAIENNCMTKIFAQIKICNDERPFARACRKLIRKYSGVRKFAATKM
ncbi:hypothetical protein DQQ10_05650 [Pseudochryseolinea flava]|uniref:Uncharacterized protein n=1 Tax=Pseudochryseolinea flava TaxID=2059302 RepID=A0A364Y4W5_9BACT|nr:hypothetical protein DQQ10_05650 [Pseudochryseolinea flava]